MLLSNLPKLHDKSIKFYTDNKHLKFNLQSGSNVEQLHETCLDFHKTCDEYQITFVVDWIPRSLNSRADHLSRCLDPDDWYMYFSI
jgi:hypothetical protein